MTWAGSESKSLSLREMSFGEFSRLTKRGNLIPIARRLPADMLTPVSAYLRLRRKGKPSFLLESVEGGEQIARYSFLGVNPFHRIRRMGAEAPSPSNRTPEVLEELRSFIKTFQPVRVPGLPPFTSGAVGYLAYDFVRQLERLPELAADDFGMPVADFLFFQDLVVFDHARQQILLVAGARIEKHSAAKKSYNDAVRRLDRMESALKAPPLAPGWSARRRTKLVAPRSNFKKQAFLDAVRRIKREIRAGEAYQVVLSQRFQIPIRKNPFDYYRALRMVNPSPYMFFLDLGDSQLVGASPEMLVRLQGRELLYRPIAGTRPRGETEEAQRRFEQQLSSSVKERAEHVMLVDLGRNDLGRIAETGTVKVDELMGTERYSHVIHLVSKLSARLRRGLDGFDALAACFPAGTVTGAPKVRAMELIEELEPGRRGIYGGAVAYMDFSGNVDSCISIRTMLIRNGTAYVQTGAGIVADSRPENEYKETLSKAQALLAAIALAEDGMK